MRKKHEYILMYQDDEVFSFSITFGKTNKIEVLEKLNHFDKAPYGINENTSKEDVKRIFFRFLNRRSIASSRVDFDNILKATNCKDRLELAFKGHGLSLHDHYWYRKKDEVLKYSDINFFTNKWDDSFAKAVLNEDYEALKKADLNVPDVVTSGWAIKGWLCEDKPRLYKLGIAKDHSEESLGEVLASRFANRIFDKGEVVEYKLKKFNNRYASVSDVMLNIDEELVPLSIVLPNDIYFAYHERNRDRKYSEEFFEKIKNYKDLNLYEFFVKLSCMRNLCFVNDLHFDNISIIRNRKTEEMRIAPLYDLAGAFGGTESARKLLSHIDKSTYIIVYFLYGNFDPKWDYSWYDPDKLIGFEDEIREILSLSDFYTPEIINNIIDVYRHQKKSLDEIAKK